MVQNRIRHNADTVLDQVETRNRVWNPETLEYEVETVSSTSDPIVVSGTVTGPLTDTELRASEVEVTGPLTDFDLRNSKLTLLMTEVLKELKVISSILLQGLNVREEMEDIRSDVESELDHEDTYLT